jgi:hypothetical protein
MNGLPKGRITRWGFLAVASLALLPVSLFAAAKNAGPIVVSINDVPNGRPVVQVQGAPNGYDIYTGEGVANPAIEDGALITLFGVDKSDSIPDWGGRFVVPDAPLWYRTAVDIVWVGHDIEGPFGNGDLQVGFNSALPGTYYFTPELIGDQNLGLVTDNWVTVYADETLVVRFKPHTYRLPVERPFYVTGIFMQDATGPGTFMVVGNATHLGKVVFPGVYSVVDVTPNDEGYLVTVHVQGTYTAANGDTIKVDGPRWVTQYRPDDSPVWSTGLINIIGGTGRFADASGSYVGNIIPGDTFILIGEGTISY